jgi:hypothetical protein
MARPMFIGWLLLIGSFLLQGCVNAVPAMPEEGTVQSNVIVGRVIAVITGERSRKFEPAVKSFEVRNRATSERFMVEVGVDNERFLLALPPGDYELIRVQINEGPFLSIAQLVSGFSIGPDPITYLGTWRFGVDSPKYGRMVSLSIVNDEQDLADIVQTLALNDPSFDREVVTTVLPDPPQLQARLFEVMPYPRVPRYFRRHWW